MQPNCPRAAGSEHDDGRHFVVGSSANTSTLGGGPFNISSKVSRIAILTLMPTIVAFNYASHDEAAVNVCLFVVQRMIWPPTLITTPVLDLYPPGAKLASVATSTWYSSKLFTVLSFFSFMTVSVVFSSSFSSYFITVHSFQVAAKYLQIPFTIRRVSVGWRDWLVKQSTRTL